MMQNSPAAPRRIVVGVDSSGNALHAALWAARQGRDLGVPVQLVHALDLGATSVYSEAAGFTKARRDEGAQLLGRVAKAVREQVPGSLVDTELSELAAPQTLVALSNESTLMVTGTRGHGGFAGMLLGSVSLKLAAHARGPVVVVRGDVPSEPYNEIVLGVEPDQAEPPIRFAYATASVFGATLTVVRAWWPRAPYGGYILPDAETTEREQITDTEALIEAVQKQYPHVKTSVLAMRGNAVPMLIEAAHDARLLVIGAHRRRSPLSVGAGYVTQGLLSHSLTPVAVIPIF